MRTNSQFIKFGIPLIVVSVLVAIAIILAIVLSKEVEETTTKGKFIFSRGGILFGGITLGPVHVNQSNLFPRRSFMGSSFLPNLAGDTFLSGGVRSKPHDP